jgi:hypothetical protein
MFLAPIGQKMPKLKPEITTTIAGTDAINTVALRQGEELTNHSQQ